MPSLAKPLVRIVTPGTREANNGNWRTAARWAAMLRGPFRVILQSAWDGGTADFLLALHARRSADCIRGFHERYPGRPIAVVLTGTDLYGDLPTHPDVARSLDIADRIVVLQDEAPRRLVPALRRKCEVIFQSALALRPVAKANGRLDCVVVGHLRDVKDPGTVFRAVALLPRELPVRILHIGAALDPSLEKDARRLAKADPRYRWAGALPHGLTRIAIRRSHVLLHPSRLEGGANVIVEAIVSGTPVIGSRMPGNVGMLGAGYPGLFPVGDADALAHMIARAAHEHGYLKALQAACNARRALFRPNREARLLRNLTRTVLA
jgi:putative glycosyltransferase (TIGR04348 family)